MINEKFEFEQFQFDLQLHEMEEMTLYDIQETFPSLSEA